MPADTGGSSGTRTTVKRSVGSSLGKVAARVASGSSGRSTSAGGGRRRARSSSRSSSGGGGGSTRRYSSGGGGGSSRRSSGGGGGSVSVPKVPKAPSVASYLAGDSVYQTGASGLKRSLSDYLSELGRRRGEATTQFNQTTKSMERDRVRQLEDLENEFASRGLIQSGLYGQEQGRFQEQFNTQMTALKQQQAALLADLLGQQKNYQRENDLNAQQLRQEALARRAARYGIG